MRIQGLDQFLLYTRIQFRRFGLDVITPVRAEGLENLVQRQQAHAGVRRIGLPRMGPVEPGAGVQRLEFRQRVVAHPAAAIGGAIEIRIVNGDEMAVPAHLDIHLKIIRARRHRLLESRPCRLRVGTTGPTVGDIRECRDAVTPALVGGLADPRHRGDGRDQ